MGSELILEIFGAIVALLYLYFEINENAAMWILSIISGILYCTLFALTGIYADAALNLYYTIMGIYGIWAWTRKSKTTTIGEERGLKISKAPIKTKLLLFLLLLLITATLYIILRLFTNSDVPLWDAIISAGSVIATWMVARKYLEHWYLWIAINTLSIALFLFKDLYITAALYLIYAAMSIIGLLKWKKTYLQYH